MVSRKKKRNKVKHHKFNWTDGVLIFIALATIVFLHRVFEVMIITETEPSATVSGFFAFVTAECAILWRIHESSKKRDSEKQDDTEIDDINDIGGEG